MYNKGTPWSLLPCVGTDGDGNLHRHHRAFFADGFRFLQHSLALQISLALLLLHGFLTTIYLVSILIFKKTITTRWTSATELLILAIDSFRAPSLASHSVRANDRKIWLEPVRVREVEYGDRLSLIVGDANSYPERVWGPPQLGKKYLQ